MSQIRFPGSQSPSLAPTLVPGLQPAQKTSCEAMTATDMLRKQSSDGLKDVRQIQRKPRTKISKLKFSPSTAMKIIGIQSTAMKNDEETSIGGAIGGPIDGHEEDQAEADMPNVQEDPASQEVPTFPEEGDHGASSSQVPSSICPAAHALLRLTSKDCTHSCTPTVDRIFKEQNMPDSG
jgi:hypothetical protein